MGLEKDENADLSAARTVTLAGQEFYVAPVLLRQILGIVDHIKAAMVAINLETVTAERINAMAMVVWHGLRRVHNSLTYEEFLDLPVTIPELIAALPVVLEQAGSRKTEPGEPAAASGSIVSTGASSSPTSA